MEKTTCQLCQSKSYSVVYEANFSPEDINKQTYSARRLPAKIHFRIVRCRRCSLVYSNPVLDEVSLTKLYQESQYTYQDQEKDLRETYGYYLKKTTGFLTSKNSFLDIGCGNGFMLEEAKKLGFKNVYGVEPSQDAVIKAKKEFRDNIKNDVFKDGQYGKDSFDLVSIFQTLDHISNPNLFLKNVAKILKKDGVVLAYNHDVSSLPAKILGENSPIIDIEHTILYDKKTMAEMFTKNGLEVVWVGSTFNLYPLSYWVRMFPLPEKLKAPLVRVLGVTGLEKLKLKIYAGNLGLIAYKI